MILDAYTRVSNAQAVTASDTVSTSSYDMGDVTPKRRLAGEPMALFVVPTVAAAGDSGTSADAFVISLIQSPNADLSAYTTILSSTRTAAALAAGTLVEIPVPFDFPTARYLGAHYDLGATDTITVTAWLAPRSAAQAFLAYAKGYAV